MSVFTTETELSYFIIIPTIIRIARYSVPTILQITPSGNFAHAHWPFNIGTGDRVNKVVDQKAHGLIF